MAFFDPVGFETFLWTSQLPLVLLTILDVSTNNIGLKKAFQCLTQRLTTYVDQNNIRNVFFNSNIYDNKRSLEIIQSKFSSGCLEKMSLTLVTAQIRIIWIPNKANLWPVSNIQIRIAIKQLKNLISFWEDINLRFQETDMYSKVWVSIRFEFSLVRQNEKSVGSFALESLKLLEHPLSHKNSCKSFHFMWYLAHSHLADTGNYCHV